jgi:hypothetical protein
MMVNIEFEIMWKEAVVSRTYISGIFLEGLRKIMKSIRILGALIRIQIRHILYTGQNHYHETHM